jgi:hypothetical protein
MSNLIAGLLQEAGSAKLIDVFLRSDIAGLVEALCGAVSRSSATTATDARCKSGALPLFRRSVKRAERKPLRWCAKQRHANRS